jgi:hypothetical protein
MIEPIKLSHVSSAELEYQKQQMLEQCSLDLFPVEHEEPDFSEAILTEAVFANGRAKVQPIVDQFGKIKSELDEELKREGANFDPKKFIKNLEFKKLENIMREVFGFRNVELMHFNEKYIPSHDIFETCSMNAYTYCTWRYPIDGLVTDDGFYDTTHSINTTVSYSLGILQKYTPEEIMAVFLHELGHNLDPALVDVKYTTTNALSKYLTDRAGKLTNAEKRQLDERGPFKLAVEVIAAAGFGALIFLTWLFSKIAEWVWNPQKVIERLKEVLQADRSRGQFSRIQNSEAFADNFARMYGFGAEFVSGMKKDAEHYSRLRKSRWQKEIERQKSFANLIEHCIKDVHKTDIHRAVNLIKEYEVDMKDPNIPAIVKKQIQEDMDEVRSLLYEFTHNFSDFENRVNTMIYDQLKKVLDDKELKPRKDKPAPVAGLTPSN